MMDGRCLLIADRQRRPCRPCRPCWCHPIRKKRGGGIEEAEEGAVNGCWWNGANHGRVDPIKPRRWQKLDAMIPTWLMGEQHYRSIESVPSALSGLAQSIRKCCHDGCHRIRWCNSADYDSIYQCVVIASKVGRWRQHPPMERGDPDRRVFNAGFQELARSAIAPLKSFSKIYVWKRRPVSINAPNANRNKRSGGAACGLGAPRPRRSPPGASLPSGSYRRY